MDDGGGFHRFLEIQVDSLQEQLHALERDPRQVEHLKSILRICQRVRHAQDSAEPESVRILRNAVEKVTLRLGRANLAVSQDFLDFYVDTFDLLEESLRHGPQGVSFDRARYGDRVRALLEVTGPRRSALPAAGDDLAVWAETAPIGAPASAADRAAADTIGLETGGGVAFTIGPGVETLRAGALGASEQAARSNLSEVPTWSEGWDEPRIEVLSAETLAPEEREGFVEADLRDLLAGGSWPEAEVRAEPAGSAARGTTPVAGAGRSTLDSGGAALDAGVEDQSAGGGLAASFATYESLRAEPGPELEAAVTRLRDILDALSLSLNDLDGASERLLREDSAALGRETLSALVERLEGERDAMLSVFDRTIESFRAATV